MMNIPRDKLVNNDINKNNSVTSEVEQILEEVVLEKNERLENKELSQ